MNGDVGPTVEAVQTGTVQIDHHCAVEPTGEHSTGQEQGGIDASKVTLNAVFQRRAVGESEYSSCLSGTTFRQGGVELKLHPTGGAACMQRESSLSIAIESRAQEAEMAIGEM